MPYLLPGRRPIVSTLRFRERKYEDDIDKYILLAGISYDPLTLIFRKINELEDLAIRNYFQRSLTYAFLIQTLQILNYEIQHHKYLDIVSRKTESIKAVAHWNGVERVHGPWAISEHPSHKCHGTDDTLMIQNFLSPP